VIASAAVARAQSEWSEPAQAAEPRAPAWAEYDWNKLDGAPDFIVGLGYSQISIGDSPAFDNESALRFEPSFSFAPLVEQVPQLRLGVAVGFSLVLDNSSRTIISRNGNLLFVGSSDVPLWLMEPELRLSWRQHFGDQHQFFIEPGVGGGWSFAFLELDADDGSGDSFSESDSTMFGRVFLRAGARVTGGLAGVEGWWTSGDTIDLGGNVEGRLDEWYVGIFGALVF
jgi:hypothetical protein